MRKQLKSVILLTALCLAAPADGAVKQRKLPKPGFNLFSKAQDVQMGQEYAKEVEAQFTVVKDQALTDYVNRIGKRLVEQGKLEGYPFSFKVVHEDSINAFALPGGPMYVHTGLIKAADNEAQLAGVLAHELSHVVLRHGTNQATKAQFAQMGAMLGGALAGGSLTGQLAQLGIGLGANSVLLKFSRGAESDSDLLGAYAMARAGYNPVEMARFFEKLESQTSNSKMAKVVELFTASHPNPGNRVKAIEEQLPFMPRGSYNASEGDLKSMQAAVAKLGAAPKPKAAAGQGSAAPLPNAQKPASVAVSGNMKDYAGGGFALSHPDNWQANAGQGSVTIAPAEGIVQGHIGYGLIASSAQMQGRKVSLEQDTQQLLQSMAQQNSNMKVAEQPQKLTIANSAAIITKMTSDSPYAGTREVDVVLTVDRGTALFYMVMIAPESDYGRLEPVFQQMVRSLRFQ